MVIVAVDGDAGIDQARLAAGRRQLIDSPVAIDEQILAVLRPIRRFDVVARVINDPALHRGEREDFEGAFDCGRDGRVGGQRGDFDIGELGLLEHVVIMRADTEAEIERFVQLDSERSSGRVQGFAGGGDVKGNIGAAPLDAQAGRVGCRGLDLAGLGVRCFAVLEASQAVAVKNRVGVSRIGFESLPEDQAGFAVRVSIRADPADVRRESHIPGHLFPDKMKRVVGEPHVFAAAADEVGAFSGVEFGGARFQDAADVTVV